MLIAKEKITSKTKTFLPGEVVTDQSAEDEARLLRLGVAERIAEEIQPEDGPETEAFQAVLEEMTLKEHFEYAKKAGIDLGKSKTKKETAGKLLQDAREKGVDVDAMSDGQILSYAKALGLDTEGKSRETVAEEIRGMFDGE